MRKLKREDVEKELIDIQRLRQAKGHSAAVFDVKTKILGRKKDADEPSVVRDPKSKELIFHPSGILKTSVDYCEKLLKNREPRAGFEDDLHWKRVVHDVRLKEKIENDIEFSDEMFEKSLKELKKSNLPKYLS